MRITPEIDKYLHVIFSDISKYEYKYRLEFLNLLESIQSTDEKEVLSLLCKVVSLRYHENQTDNPFIPVSDFIDNDFENLEEVLQDIHYPVLTARIADFLWTMKKNILYADKAMESYKQCADITFDVDEWTTCFGFIKKSARIACLLGKKNKPYKDFCSFVDSVIRKINGTDPLFLSISLIELLFEMGYNKLGDYTIILDKIIEDACNKRDLHRVEVAFELKVKLLHKIGDSTTKLSTQTAYAQHIEKMAQDTQKIEGFINTQRAISLYEKAVLLYRQANKQEDSNRVRRILEPLKRTFAENMPSISQTIDRKSTYDQLNKFAAHRNLEEQIAILSLLTSFPTKQMLEDQVLSNHRKFLFSTMFGSILLDRDGKAIIQIPPLDMDNPKVDIVLLEKHMHREAATLQNYNAILYIDIFFHIIRETHGSISLDNLSFLIDDNFILPDDRKHIFKLGIMYGINGDYYAALHLLVPQIENLFRTIAAMCGGLVTTFEEDATEQFKALSTVFDSPELQECYDENILFIFKGLLNEKAGANLRNRIAHGITDNAEGNSPIAMYFLAAVIKLCSWYSKPCLDILPDLIHEIEESLEHQPLNIDNTTIKT